MVSHQTEPPLGLYCDTCGRPLKPNPRNPRKRFCSRKCLSRWHYEHHVRPKRLQSQISQVLTKEQPTHE